MGEWQLFPPGTVPDFTTPEFFAAHRWVPPQHQIGHRQRTAMAARLIADVVAEYGCESVSDLGCGDGSLLEELAAVGVHVPTWGYDAGRANVARAQSRGLDVRQADLFSDELAYGDLVTACEVVEHLADPHSFVRGLPGRVIVLSSPSTETADWHYVHHAWAWDLDGYAELVTNAGWQIIRQVDCEGGINWHNGKPGNQRFQAIAAVRPQEVPA